MHAFDGRLVESDGVDLEESISAGIAATGEDFGRSGEVEEFDAWEDEYSDFEWRGGLVLADGRGIIGEGGGDEGEQAYQRDEPTEGELGHGMFLLIGVLADL